MSDLFQPGFIYKFDKMRRVISPYVIPKARIQAAINLGEFSVDERRVLISAIDDDGFKWSIFADECVIVKDLSKYDEEIIYDPITTMPKFQVGKIYKYNPVKTLKYFYAGSDTMKIIDLYTDNNRDRMVTISNIDKFAVKRPSHYITLIGENGANHTIFAEECDIIGG